MNGPKIRINNTYSRKLKVMPEALSFTTSLDSLPGRAVSASVIARLPLRNYPQTNCGRNLFFRGHAAASKLAEFDLY
jgi:hypothetical protein